MLTYTPTGPSGLPRLLGRAGESAALEHALERLAEGRGGLLWVEGEPGIGKSALAGLLAESASALGVGVLKATADELMSEFPLRLMAGCLGVSRRPDASADVDGARAEIAGLLRGGADHRRVSDPVLAAGERMLDLVDRLCTRRPQVLIMDDMQWADEPSLRLWGQLADSVDQIPLLLVGLSRSVSEPAVLERLRDRVRRGGVLLRPGPLEAPQVRELAGLVVGATPGPGLLTEIARAQGNPLYVVELVEALRREGLIAPVGRAGSPDTGIGTAAGGGRGPDVARQSAAEVEFTGRPGTTPDSLTTVIGARLGYLDVRVRTTLRLAALLGTEFNVSQLAKLAGLAPAELITVLAAAQEAGVVGPGSEGLAFRHVLIQEVLVEQMPEAVRNALHGEIALTLAGSGAGLDAVARHLLAVSGPFEAWAVAWLVAMPVTALYGAPKVADELLTRALEVVPKTDPDWPALAENLAQVRFWLGRDHAAAELALEVARAAEDVDGRARMWTLAARAAGRAGSFQETAAIAEQALATPGLSLSWQAQIECWYAIALRAIGSDGQEQAGRSLAHGLESGDPLSIAYGRHAIYMCTLSTTAMEQLIQAGAALGESVEAAEMRIMIYANRASWYFHTEAEAEVREKLISEVLVLAERSGMHRGGAMLRFAASHYFDVGQWKEALGYLARIEQQALETAGSLDGHALRALIYALRGDRAAAEQELAAAQPLLDTPQMAAGVDTTLVRWLPTVRAVLAETDGDPAGALALLEESILGQAQELDRSAQFDDVPDLVRLGLLVGRTDVAGRAVRALEKLLETMPHPALTASAAHAAALLAGAPEALLAAADMYSRIDWTLRRGSALESAAVLFAEAGSVEQARAALTAAADCYTDLGAVLLLRRLESRLRGHGIRRGSRSHHRRARSGWAALTPTERAVAEMLGREMSNPEIAAQLFLSRYTIQAHVSRILAKLGFASRVEVARAFADGRLPEPQEENGPKQ
jgi:DNA-binding CsgD family transcriptional regulator